MISNSPKITILMATWNRAKLLGRAIESVRSQTFNDWELVIVDDGSTDSTEAVVKEWQKKEPRVVYVKNPINQGISKNYNSGFKIAKGEYVAMVDDDDPWHDPKKLEKQVKFLDEHPDYVGCGGGVIVISLDHKELYRYLKPQTDTEIRGKMLFGNPMANSTTLFRRVVGEKVGWYDESNRYSGDRDFWLKMGLKGKLYNLPEYFSYYTITGANTSILKMKPHLRASLVIMRRYKNDYPSYRLALVFNWIQYAYSFLPNFIKQPVHASLARLKRLLVG